MDTSDDLAEGTSAVVSFVLEWLVRIGGVKDGAMVVTSSSWYRIVVPSSSVVER
jgi:hypothetical protein